MTGTVMQPCALSVCLVEDDEAIRVVLTTIMAREGWSVWSVESALDAVAGLDARRAEGQPIRVLITDRNLASGENGEVLARRAREDDPTLAVVVISGDYDSVIKLEPGVVLLPKPFRRAAFLDAVEAARAGTALR